MAELTEEQRQAQEIKDIKDNSPFALPDDPSSSGWSTAQIKEKHWMALVILYGYIVAERVRINTLETGKTDVAIADIAKILSGELLANKALNDKTGADITVKYATYDFINSGLTVPKYLKRNGNAEFIYTIEEGLTALRTAYETFVSTYFTNGKANNAVNAESATKAMSDDLGNIIKNTYATIASLGQTNTEITNIKNGNTTVMKAYKDQFGNIIDQVYAKLTNLNELVKIVGYAVSGDNATITYTTKGGTTNSVTIPCATSSNAGLMSPSDVAEIATLVAKVAAFEELTRRLSYTAKSNPTKAEILAFVQECGYTDERTFYGIKVVVSATNHVWIWYDNLDEFADVGIETVQAFTNSSTGSIKGSTARGKVYAENDGTGSLVGYDQLNNNVAPPYSDQVTYSKGDVRIYEGVLYQANTDIGTAEAFNSSKWDIVNLKALLDQKLGKSSTAFSLYATTSDGQTMIGYGLGANGGKIPQRDSNGQINVPLTPTNNEHATSKKYVDDECAKKQNVIDNNNKLSADLLDDASTTKKTVTAAEKLEWSGKQDDVKSSIVDGKLCITYEA